MIAVPADRPRGTRPSRQRHPPDNRAIKTDAKQLSDIRRLTELEAQIGERKQPPVNLDAIKRQAEAFVIEHAAEILTTARALYRNGTLFVPAPKPLNTTAGGIVPPGHEPHYPIAAKAAEGQHDPTR